MIKTAVNHLFRFRFGLPTALLILTGGLVDAAIADDDETRDRIQKRIQMTQTYLKSKTATRIIESGSEEAKQLLEKARQLLEEGQQDLEEGRFDSAQQKLSLSIQTFSAAGTANSKKSSNTKQKLLAEVDSLKGEIDGYLASFNTALAEKGPSMAGLLDQQQVDSLISTAERSQSSGDYRAAHTNLTRAKQLIVDALIKIRNNETVVYAVEFQTPADEFRYESDRYKEYVSLSNQIIENGEVAESRVKLFNMQKDAGEAISEEAQALASSGDYEAAIKRMEDAVKKMVQGLRVLGIQLSM